jgi:hypothetical protein
MASIGDADFRCFVLRVSLRCLWSVLTLYSMRFRAIVGYNRPYRVYTDGSVYSLDGFARTGNGRRRTKGKKLNVFTNRRGYLSVSLSVAPGKSRLQSVHRIIATAFIPNPRRLPQVNHKNGIKKDNRIRNLEWCTNRQNMDHAIKLGLTKKNHHNPRQVLTPQNVRAIRLLSSPDIKILASRFNVHKETIGNVISRKTWQSI